MVEEKGGTDIRFVLTFLGSDSFLVMVTLIVLFGFLEIILKNIFNLE